MKTAACLVAILASASAFAPQPAAVRQTTAVNGLFDDIAAMDLFAPVKDQNDYGARSKKNLKTGAITSNSYVPSGLTAEEYKKIRAADEAKRDSSYKNAVAKAGKFLGFDEFYEKRGTNLDGAWRSSGTLGHRMAKTKYDYSGGKDEQKKPESFTAGGIFGRK